MISPEVYTLRLSWPDSRLASNARVHWRPKAAATKAARHEAWAIAKTRQLPTWPEARLTFTFYPPDRRRRDMQNMPGMMKAYIDGIADAMGCDDNKFRCVWPEAFGDVVQGGSVRVEVSE